MDSKNLDELKFLNETPWSWFIVIEQELAYNQAVKNKLTTPTQYELEWLSFFNIIPGFEWIP